MGNNFKTASKGARLFIIYEEKAWDPDQVGNSTALYLAESLAQAEGWLQSQDKTDLPIYSYRSDKKGLSDERLENPKIVVYEEEEGDQPQKQTWGDQRRKSNVNWGKVALYSILGVGAILMWSTLQMLKILNFCLGGRR